ncbi:hypothetical protein TNCT_307001 [Trichonephila clavata]|uniref:Uncharacterized protein n=1 Tax=Trichonephila clavata TaxID=2740835 RepID=A0A8X6JCZ7_TRICU|nr:hypothetical protein TNCT_307001 [Trichonephila clavata]
MNQIHLERFVEHEPGRGQAWKPKVSFPFVSLNKKRLLLAAKRPYQLLSEGVVDLVMQYPVSFRYMPYLMDEYIEMICSVGSHAIVI